MYVEEVSFRAKSIEGVSTSTAGFVSVSARGPLLGPFTSFADFEHAPPLNASRSLALAVRGFFDNGGQRCFVSQVAPGDPLESGLTALDAHPVSIVCCPDDPAIPNAPLALVAHCEKRKDRICILQSPQPGIPSANHQPTVHSSYAAYYYPWLSVPDLHGTSTANTPPCGHIAGIFARVDTNRGVWRAPANEQIVGVQSLSSAINNTESDLLHSRGINSIRSFPSQGIRLWSAVTTSQDPEWKYVNVRRYFLFLERSIDQGIQWAVFEPNCPSLWAEFSARIEFFLHNQWKAGALLDKSRKKRISFVVTVIR